MIILSTDQILARHYSKVCNYVEVNQAAVKEMHRQVSNLVLNEQGIAQRGLLIRPLVLPNNIVGTDQVLQFIAEETSLHTYLNLKDQPPCSASSPTVNMQPPWHWRDATICKGWIASQPRKGSEIMFRKALFDMLLNHPMSIKDLVVLLDEHPKDIEDDLHHQQKSLHNMPYKMLVEPARCNKCEFLFHSDKLHKPGKCPHCHGTWISEPLISIEKE